MNYFQPSALFLEALILIAPAVVASNTALAQNCPVAIGRDPPVRCDRVEERLRIDPRARRNMSPWGSPNSFAPLPETNAMFARQRLDGRYGMNSPRLR